jgi:mannose-6-phosphate isomerase
MTAPAIPLRFQPVYQTYLWGGERLRSQLGRQDTPEGIVAESWEITDRPDGMSVVSGGPLLGKTFRELISADPVGMLGHRCRGDRFPLLIKVLDAAQTLSVQVHPNDETAARFGGEAKTETWYILEASPDAAVFCGLAEGVTPETFRSAIAENRLDPLLKKIPVKAGDAIFVPGGRVHAIASGCLLLEVQQNSNTTYRIYDWGRVDAQGKSRELHVDQALQVTLWQDAASALTPAEPLPPLNGIPRERIMESPYFRLERLHPGGRAVISGDAGSFQVLFAIDADMTVEAGGVEVAVPRGASVFLPAKTPHAQVDSAGAVMRITLP